MNIGDLVFGLRGDGAPLKKDAEKAGADAGETGAKSFDKSFSGRIKSLKADLGKGGGISGALLGGVGLGAGLGAFSAISSGVGMVTDALADSVKKAIEEQAGMERLGAALKANIPAWNGNTDAIEKVIAEREKLAFSDGDQRDSLALLVGITHDATKALDLQRQAMDLARLRGISLSDASTILGKVYSGNTAILKRYGIQVKKGSTATQALAQVQKQSAGQADAYANTAQGSFESLQIAIDDAEESIGQKLLPTIKNLAEFTRDTVVPAVLAVVDAFGELGRAVDDYSKIQQTRMTDFDRTLLQGMADANEWLRMQDTLAKVLGETADEFNAELNRRLADGTLTQEQAIAQVWEEVKANRFIPAAAKEAVKPIGEAVVAGIVEPIRTVPEEAKKALEPLTDEIPGVLKKTRQGINKRMGDIMWSLEHPLTEANLKKKYHDAIHGGTVAMNRALKEGNAAALAKATKFVHDMQVELNKLSDADWAMWLTGQVKAGRPKGELRPGRAAGGPVTRGMPYIVGERRPELFVPDSSGTILPSVPSAGRMDVWHHLDQTAARNIVAVGGDAAGVAAILLSASQSAGARYSTPRRS
jgi:hypothetical protein